MGSHDFQNSTGGKNLTASEAYKELCDDARYESGNDSYNGTISTTSGFRMFNYDRRNVDALIDTILEDENGAIQKWGPAGCIELKTGKLVEWKKANGYVGKRGIRAYVFFGWAAS